MSESANNQGGRQAGTGQSRGARQKAIDAYDRAGRKVGNSFDEAPLVALAGGLAAGALIAALLPRTDSETRAVRPTAKRLDKSARAAVGAAKEAGSARLDELGLTADRGLETLRSIFESAGSAARRSAEEALGNGRRSDG